MKFLEGEGQKSRQLRVSQFERIFNQTDDRVVRGRHFVIRFPINTQSQSNNVGERTKSAKTIRLGLLLGLVPARQTDRFRDVEIRAGRQLARGKNGRKSTDIIRI